MAFGITPAELKQWKDKVSRGEIAYLTHYWQHPKFPNIRTVTKVGCADLAKLINWCHKNDLPPEYIHRRADYPHFDLIGKKQVEILSNEGLIDHIKRFRLDPNHNFRLKTNIHPANP